jgi:hypothetical protein
MKTMCAQATGVVDDNVGDVVEEDDVDEVVDVVSGGEDATRKTVGGNAATQRARQPQPSQVLETSIPKEVLRVYRPADQTDGARVRRRRTRLHRWKWWQRCRG